MKTKVDLARSLRREFGPERPTNALARILKKRHPLRFKNSEDARDVLRQIEGKKGKNIVSVTPEFKVDKARPYNPYNLPKSDEETYEPFVITGHTRGLILNDIHLPYHNVEALTAALEYGKKQRPDFIFLNGDVLDFHKLSYFQKDPEKKSFAEELQVFSDFIAQLKKIFRCPIYYKFGNHEERYDSFLKQKAGELVGVDEFELENIIRKRADVTVIRDKRIVVIAGLPFIHGHEFGRGVFNPVNAARGLSLQAKHSCVKGDCHTTSEHSDPDIFRKLITTWSVGCLCGLTPRWLPLNRWNNGFAMIDIVGEQQYRFRNYRIQNGIVY